MICHSLSCPNMKSHSLIWPSSNKTERCMTHHVKSYIWNELKTLPKADSYEPSYIYTYDISNTPHPGSTAGPVRVNFCGDLFSSFGKLLPLKVWDHNVKRRPPPEHEWAGDSISQIYRHIKPRTYIFIYMTHKLNSPRQDPPQIRCEWTGKCSRPNSPSRGRPIGTRNRGKSPGEAG
jgi:hypothetical protein